MSISNTKLPATERRRSRIALRWVFALTVAALPIQLAIAAAVGEPYPALFQPAFRGSPQQDNFAIVEVPKVTLISDAGEREVPYTEILPPSDQLSTPLFNSLYKSEKRRTDPRTIAWLTELLAEREPDKIRSVVIEWQNAHYEIGDARILSETLADRVEIDLERN